MNKVNVFKNKKLIPNKLLKYGFKKVKSSYVYNCLILNGEFEFFIKIDADKGDVSTELKEVSTDEIYTLHLLPDAEGVFVGKVKEEYDNILNDIKTKCFETGIFEWNYTYRVIDYCRSKYGDEPEYLWKRTPRNAICRRKDNKKWYLALLSVGGDKLGLKSDEIIEVINLRVKPDEMQEILVNKNIHPAYHMNKKNWVTIILDGSVQIDKIFKMIDTSYEIALKK